MVLDGEQDEALRVLGEERLIEELLLWFWGSDCLDLLLLVLKLGIHLGLEGGEVGIEGLVFLVGWGKVELLDGRLHLEGVNGGSSLQK